MKFFLTSFFAIFFCIFLTSCQTVSQKIDDITLAEEQELNKWLNKNETELKIEFGRPDNIKFKNSGNREYIYITKKLKIKCERRFEINPNNIVIGYSSKNCF
tara:strand:- start:440 stop:745 length:306 start_codon:yes stop_codon:yes gene_type:complete